MNTRLAVELACLLEATARKPGNAHRDRDLPKLTYLQLVAAGLAIGPILSEASSLGLGMAILRAAQATRAVAGTNANLGIILLLAPLCILADRQQSLESVNDVLASLTIEDTKLVYEAIRTAEPGGMNKVEDHDIQDVPTIGLVEAMTLAADRDSVARQYSNGFRDVRELGLPVLLEAIDQGSDLEDAILWCQLHWMARFPDTLIARKLGTLEAEESAVRAAAVLRHFSAGPAGLATASVRPGPLADFDQWLTAKGQARNPGTTADLVTACLFWGLHLERIDARSCRFHSQG
jgi:triphosphoribosyl-dephospho-CoA synthase